MRSLSRMSSALAECTSNHLARSSFLQQNDPGCVYITIMASSCCECYYTCEDICENNLFLKT